MKFIRRLSSALGHVSLVLFVLGASAGLVSADPILPGFDLFATDSPGTSAFLPGIGLVDFKGVPLEPLNLGNTDTIVQRFGGLPSGGTGPIPIELVALELKSTMPVNIGGNFYDLYAVINKGNLIPGLPQPDPLLPSTGTLTVLTHNDITGTGTFNSFFDVFVDIELTLPGNDPRVPGNIVASMPSGDEGPFQANGSWSHTAPPNYPNDPSFPAGNFYPLGRIVETGPMAMHTVESASNATPEPASLTLLSIAGVCFGGYAWRRRKVQVANA